MYLHIPRILFKSGFKLQGTKVIGSLYVLETSERFRIHRVELRILQFRGEC
jgi:hypothetical protein